MQSNYFLDIKDKIERSDIDFYGKNRCLKIVDINFLLSL